VYLLNADGADVPFQLPTVAGVDEWECLIDTADEARQGTNFPAGKAYPLTSRSVAVLRAAAAPATPERS
jgi:hypothetical protein